jgi:hypothetical protein
MAIDRTTQSPVLPLYPAAERPPSSNWKCRMYLAPYSPPAAAADAVTSSLSVVTRRASIFNPLFMSKRCLRSKLFTNSRVALPIAPAMLDASTLIVRPSEPTLRSSYFSVTLYVFKAVSLNGFLFAGWVGQFSLAHLLDALRSGLGMKRFE